MSGNYENEKTSFARRISSRAHNPRYRRCKPRRGVEAVVMP